MSNSKSCGNEVQKEIENLRREKEILVKEQSHIKNQLEGVNKMLDKINELLERLGYTIMEIAARIGGFNSEIFKTRDYGQSNKTQYQRI